MTRFANVQSQLPELWINRTVRTQGSPVTTVQVMRYYKHDSEATTLRFLENLLRHRRVKKIQDSDGKLLGWDADV